MSEHFSRGSPTGKITGSGKSLSNDEDEDKKVLEKYWEVARDEAGKTRCQNPFLLIFAFVEIAHTRI